MQGRPIGQSLADKTTDIQRVNTVLERNMLDGLYHNLRPALWVNEDAIGEHTVDDILTVYPGAIRRWKGQIKPEADRPNDMSAVAMQAIEFKIRQRESRTGITRLNKGVDEDTLNDTAKGQAQLMSRGQQMERYIIRNFAEGVARLFMKKVGLMRKYAQPFQIRVDGQYRQVDPSNGPRTWRFRWLWALGRGRRKTGSWAGSRWARFRRCSSNPARRSSPTTISTTTRSAWRETMAWPRTTCSPSRPRTSRATRFRNSSRPTPRCRR
jgi:hypothetical protein